MLTKFNHQYKEFLKDFIIQFICSTIKMIFQQFSSQIQRVQEVSTAQQYIQQILRLNHHQPMLNNLYQRFFQQYFGGLVQPFTINQYHARDKLIFVEQQQQMKCFYKLQQIVKTIRESVLTRIKQDRIAPILVYNQNQYQIKCIVQKRKRAWLTQIPESNTMHTEISSKNNRCKILFADKNILPRNLQNLKNNFSKNNDMSSEILSKVAQDLSRMIQNVYIKKSNNQNKKLGKNIVIKYEPLKKYSKKMLQFQNISIIRGVNEPNQFRKKSINFDEPEQNYGLRKNKKLNSKSNQIKNRKKKHYLSSQLSKVASSRKISDAITKRDSFQRLKLSPLTPNPISSSKLRQGWIDNINKNSRFSMKSHLSRGNKSKSGKLQRLEKSPSLTKKLSPKNRIIEHKSPKYIKKVER